MRYVQINSFYNGSTGTIMRGLHKELLEQGHDSYVFWGRRHETVSDHERRCASKAGVCLHGALTRLTGRAGFYSRRDTARLLEELDRIDPDVVHLHNVHGYYVNVEMLFEWLAAHRCQVRWTLHDCWAFTGHCAYFTYVKCAQWQSRCAYEKPCCQLSTYPKTISKRSCIRNFDDKKRLFGLVPAERMELITPSKWLADLVGESFLSKYLVTVKHNEIDRTVFKPTPSDFRERYGIGDRFMVLGVASPWTERKGLGDFEWLAANLDERYAVVLVGLSSKQMKQLPANAVGLGRVDGPAELAGIYTAADLFVNPSREETYGMTVAEAAACGTPVAVVEGSACVEVAEVSGAEAHVIAADLSDLRATVIRLGGGASS
ncbi:MAG TPA: glycosyltransferase [Gordonibacter urolithinfaciens]|uniref:glycosyltransferase n=1 Tax=Gordonibacter TaxID=644652 RepID=UPI001D8F9CC0|nr:MULTISPECIES: glycosyltransferase [Gordonibacter]MDN4509839.1 glycosyltransferase [Gordonibacter sp. RACS_AR49]HJF64206.1 glycosyltransferase [Gordonibacter urolithinfaciens]